MKINRTGGIAWLSAVITFTTDFGPDSPYVAAMKGVILGINPDASLADISHSIEPQNILQAAYVIDSVFEYFPPGTVHVIVVDPGVGTSRRGIILKTGKAAFVAPDNGVLSGILNRLFLSEMKASASTGRLKLPDSALAIHLTRPEFWLPEVSATFHGRDVFAPVAARLSLGFQPDEFGIRTNWLTVLRLPRPVLNADGSLTGHVVYVDSFGNLITDITAAYLTSAPRTLEFAVRGHAIRGLSVTYAEDEGLLALIGSSGCLEIALKNSSAARFLGGGIGDEVKVTRVDIK